MIGDPIYCVHPRIIVRSDASQLLTFYRRYVMHGRVYDFTKTSGPLYFPELKEVKKYGKDFSESHNWREICDKVKELHSSYYLLSKDGDIIPVIMLVPCGHCDLCLNRKTLDFTTRCDIETSLSHNSAFITLTYNNDHLPVNNSLYKHVAQRWIKRCRKFLSDRGYDGQSFKYFIVGEYGSKSGRPHYHAIIWNLPDDYVSSFSDTWHAYKNLCDETWCNKYRLYGDDGKCLRNENGGFVFGIDSYGFVYIGDTSRDSIRYCAKYMRKGSVTPDGCEPPFRLYSYKPTIGFEFCDQWREWYRNHPHETEISYTRLDGTLVTVPIPAYFKNKWFPSKSKVLPYKIYQSYKAYERNAFLCESDRILAKEMLESADYDDPLYPELYAKQQRLINDLTYTLYEEEFIVPDWYRRYFGLMFRSGDLPDIISSHIDALNYHWSIIQDVDFDEYDRIVGISRERSEWIRCVPRETLVDPDVALSKLLSRRAVEKDRETF